MNFSSMKYLLKEGVKNVWNNRMMSFASIGVLVSCLLLTGAAVLFSANLSYAMKDIQDENVVTVYLKQEVGELEAVTLGSELKEIPNIKEIVFVSQQEALEQYTEILGPLFEGLEEDNFLPNAYRVTMEDLSLYDETVAKIKEIPQVDTLSDRSDAASKLTNLNNMVGTAGLWILIILSVVSLFIISNTIRVTMYSRRLEISIMKSVGATNWFIRVPFIVEGVVIGLISAGISILVLKLVYESIMSAVKQLIPFTSIPLPLLQVLWCLDSSALSIAFGALGGIISISKYLKKEGGEILGW